MKKIKVEDFLTKLFTEDYKPMLDAETGIILVETGWLDMAEVQKRFEELIKEIGRYK